MEATLSFTKHTTGATYVQHHIYIQAKGFGAGKPSPTPLANCYVIFAADELEKNLLYWICYCLWKSGSFNTMLKVSYGYQLDIDSAITLIDDAFHTLSTNPTKAFTKLVELRSLIKTEVLLNAQLKMIQRIKRALAKNILK